MSTSLATVERGALMRYMTSRWKRSKLELFAQGAVPADPGFGQDEVCPLLYYDHEFDPTKQEHLQALSAYSVRELSGYGYIELTVLTGPWSGEELALKVVGTQWKVTDPDQNEVVVYPGDDMVNGATVTFTLEDDSTFDAQVAYSFLHGVGFGVLNLAELRTEKLGTSSRSQSEATVRLLVNFAAPPANAVRLAEIYGAATAMIFRGLILSADESAAAETYERRMFDAGIHVIHQQSRDSISERPVRIGEADGYVWHMCQVIVRRYYFLPSVRRQTVEAP